MNCCGKVTELIWHWGVRSGDFGIQANTLTGARFFDFIPHAATIESSESIADSQSDNFVYNSNATDRIRDVLFPLSINSHD